MLDIHILIHEAAHRDWLEEAIASIDGATLDGFIHVHLLDNGDSVGEGRAKAYRLGAAPFVAALDCDDVVIADAIPGLVRLLASHELCAGAFSDELRADEALRPIGVGESTGTGEWDPLRQLLYMSYGRHLCLYRREAIEPYLNAIREWPRLSDYVLMALATEWGEFVHYPYDAYLHRAHPDNTSKSTPASLARKAVLRAQPYLRRASVNSLCHKLRAQAHARAQGGELWRQAQHH